MGTLDLVNNPNSHYCQVKAHGWPSRRVPLSLHHCNLTYRPQASTFVQGKSTATGRSRSLVLRNISQSPTCRTIVVLPIRSSKRPLPHINLQRALRRSYHQKAEFSHDTIARSDSFVTTTLDILHGPNNCNQDNEVVAQYSNPRRFSTRVCQHSSLRSAAGQHTTTLSRPSVFFSGDSWCQKSQSFMNLVVLFPNGVGVV
jgi:hypothetical protein